jgi:putative glycosyltransferase (TIGR04348 family)
MPRLMIVTPAPADAHNGNAHTAARWQRMLAPLAEVTVAMQWQGEPVDALIALHARKSAASIAAFRAAHPRRPLAVVLTGTDLYVDLEAGNASALHALQCASHVVVLQPVALRRLDEAARRKAVVIVQSAEALVDPDKAADVIAVGHLRAVKDPGTLWAAARLLGSDPTGATLRVLHIGDALDASLGEEAKRTMAECPGYRWLGGLPAAQTRRWIARSRLLVHPSLAEGGAHVVIEAVRSQVPVLASRIDGNLGLLGEDYPGCFPPGDAGTLAALIRRFFSDGDFAATLAARCTALSPRFAPDAEAAALRALWSSMCSTIRA